MNAPTDEPMVKVHFGSDIADLLQQSDGRLSQYVFEGSVKSAASNLFSRADIQRLSPPKGKFGIHKVVMGSQELYGPNRNADGYPAEGLMRNLKTFEKIALCFREHDNKDPRKSLGIIKEARWDPDLQRIETFSWVDCEKAPEEYAAARRGEELAFSQACRVREDECSCCHHKAARAADYCDDLKYNMLQFLPRFQKYAFAINRDPKFFDESFVKRGADRIARYLSYKFADEGEMQKAAAAGMLDVISGIDWANAMGLSRNQELHANAFDHLEKLAAAESHLREIIRHAPHDTRLHYANMASLLPDVLDVSVLRAVTPGTLMNKFASAQILLPFDCFVAYATGRDLGDVRQDEALIKLAEEQLPTMFTAMAKVPCSQCDVDMFAPSGDYSAKTDPSLSPVVDAVFAEAHSKFSAKDEPSQARLIEQIFACPEHEKKASQNKVQRRASNEATEELHPLISFYGAFKLASVINAAERGANLESLCECACIQNFNF